MEGGQPGLLLQKGPRAAMSSSPPPERAVSATAVAVSSSAAPPQHHRRARSDSWLPVDHYGLVYIVFFLQGVGMLFPWNVFITAAQYFHVRLKGTAFQDNFENVFSFSYSFSNLIFMFVAVRWAHLPLFNMRSTVVLPQIVTAAIFAATTAMVLDDAIPGTMLFVVTTLFVLVTGVTAALIQAGIFGLAGRFPSVYTQAVMSGQGVAGMTVSVISLITALSAPCTGSGAAPSWHQIQPASFNYFLSSTIVILLTLIAFVLLTRSDFAQFYAFATADDTADALSAASGTSPSGSIHDYAVEYSDPADGRTAIDLAEAMDRAMLTPRTRRRIIETRRSIMAAPVFQARSPPSSAHSSRRSTPGTQTPRSRSLPKGMTSASSSRMRRGVAGGHARSRTDGSSGAAGGSSGGSSSYSSGMNSPSGLVSPGGTGGRPPRAQQPVAMSDAAVAAGIRPGGTGGNGANMNTASGVSAALLRSNNHAHGAAGAAGVGSGGDGTDAPLLANEHGSGGSGGHGEWTTSSNNGGGNSGSGGADEYAMMRGGEGPHEIRREHDDEYDDEEEEERLPTCDLIRMLGRHCFSVCFVFLITLSVFPGITSEIRSKHNLENARCPTAGRFYGAGVWQAMFFLLFNGGDTIGRLLAAARQCINPSYVYMLSMGRFVFVPLFLLCNVAASTPSVTPGSGNHTGVTPSTKASAVFTSFYTANFAGLVDTEPFLRDPRLGYFENDAWPIVFMLLLSVSNGYVASLEMMNAPARAPDGQQSRAGTNMAFFLVMGIFLGSVFSFPVRALACNCNPFVG
jgi:hypothetical protein